MFTATIVRAITKDLGHLFTMRPGTRMIASLVRLACHGFLNPGTSQEIGVLIEAVSRVLIAFSAAILASPCADEVMNDGASDAHAIGGLACIRPIARERPQTARLGGAAKPAPAPNRFPARVAPAG